MNLFCAGSSSQEKSMTSLDEGDITVDDVYKESYRLQDLLDAIADKDEVKSNELFTMVRNSNDLLIQGDEGETILHIAVRTGEEGMVRLVLQWLWKFHLDYSVKWTKDSDGCTPVHLAVKMDNPDLVSLLFDPELSSSMIELRRISSVSSLINPFSIPSTSSDILQLALFEASVSMASLVLDHSVGNPVKFYQGFDKMITLEIPSTYELEMTVPLVVVGDSGAGKSSLIRSLQVEGKFPWLKHSFFNVPGADTHTAGIIPTQFESIWFGKVVFFDLSSHREYVHEAILNCGSLKDAVFLIVVNLSNSNKKIAQQIIYWLEFVRYHYSKVSEGSPNVIIVGSHLIDFKLGPFLKRERFRIHSLPLAMENIDQTRFNITKRIELDCRKTTPENAILRYEIKDQCERIRQSRNPLPSKSYILHAVIHELASKEPNAVRAVTIADLLEELKTTDKLHCQLFQGTVDEVLKLCEELKKLNLLLVLKDESSIEDSWIVPDSYPLLCQIEAAIFPNEQGQLDSTSHEEYVDNGVLTDSDVRRKFSKLNLESNADLLILVMLHYKYCEVVSIGNDEKGYFFPHLLKPFLEIPQWNKEEISKDRFMFAWTIAPESRYHYFMPHLVHHFLLELSQAEELHIHNLERATRSLAWGDPSGVEVVVHIHSSQRLLVSMRSTPDHQLSCLRLRKLVLKKVTEILESLKPEEDVAVIESFIPIQRKVVLPYTNNDPTTKDKIRLYKTDTIKSVIVNQEAAVAPSSHALPLMTVDDILFFEPYYHIGCSLRERLYQLEDDDVTEEDYHDIGMSLGPVKLRYLDELLDNVEQPCCTEQSLPDQVRQSYLCFKARHGKLTYKHLKETLNSISYFELDEIFNDSKCLNQQLT